MKYILLVAFFSSIHAIAQFSTSFINFNNVEANVTDGGLLFTNSITSNHGYEIPKGAGSHAIYSSAFWFGGIDQNSQLHLSGTRYGGGEDIFPGPIADSGMYNSAGYTSAYSTSIWGVYQAEINNHIVSWNQPGYTVPPSIASWPGNGDPSIGVAEQLAPYVDVNDNGIYEPALGDYPNIRGGFAKYIIMNDGAQAHTSSGGAPLGIEVHLMIYQYSTSDYMNNVTFINARVFNRGTTDYQNFKTSYYVDGDLGNYSDDYVGSDSLRNMIFTYNGDAMDESNGGVVGYGANPPAIGVVSLGQEMGGAGYFTSTASAAQSDPVSAGEYWNYMNNMWRFGDPWVYGGTGFIGTAGATNIPTNYLFNPNLNNGFEWTEVTNFNPPGDRRMFMNLAETTLPPGGKICYDLAVVFGEGTAPFGSLSDLENNVDMLQSYFDGESFSCETVTVGDDELSLIEATIYPNPSSGEVHVLLSEALDQFSLNVMDVSGRIIFSGNYKNQLEIDLNLKGHEGVYFIQIETEMGSSTQRILLN